MTKVSTPDADPGAVYRPRGVWVSSRPIALRRVLGIAAGIVPSQLMSRGFELACGKIDAA